MAAEFGREPRRCGPVIADVGLLLRARLEACADIMSVSRSAPELWVMLLRCVLPPSSGWSLPVHTAKWCGSR
jgi:hypothetical protein